MAQRRAGQQRINPYVVLIGFKGCGKTTVGRLLAELLERPFQDLDILLEATYTERYGSQHGFREIFRERGENFFRGLERQCLATAMSGIPKVLALGGGTPINCRDELEAAKPSVTICLIYVRPQVLLQRILANGLPAFFDSANPEASFRRLYRQRLPRYRGIAQHVVDNSDCTPNETARQLAKMITVLR